MSCGTADVYNDDQHPLQSSAELKGAFAVGDKGVVVCLASFNAAQVNVICMVQHGQK